MSLYDLSNLAALTDSHAANNNPNNVTNSTVPNPQGDNLSGAQKNDPENKPIDETVTDPNKVKRTIVLDGPLSHVYTSALRKALAFESMAATALPMKLLTTGELTDDDDNSQDTKDLFVYCCDGNNLSQADLAENTKKLNFVLEKAKNYTKKIFVLECKARNSNKNTALLEAFAESQGFKVIYSKDRLISNVEVMKP